MKSEELLHFWKKLGALASTQAQQMQTHLLEKLQKFAHSRPSVNQWVAKHDNVAIRTGLKPWFIE